MKDDALDRPLHLVALVRVRGHDVHDLTWNAVFVAQRHAAKRVPEHVAEMSLHWLTLRVLVELEHLSDVGQKCSRNQHVPIDWNAVAEDRFENLRNRDALLDARIQMLDEGQINFTRQQRERDGADFSKGPTFAAAPGRE